MTEEEQKERRRKQANAIRVLASPVRMSMEDFDRRYRQRWVITDAKARDNIESTSQEMFCDQCLTPSINEQPMQGNILHVTVEDDPLRNFWKLATMRCYRCGFEEIVPLDQPSFTPNDFNTLAGSISPGQIMRVEPYRQVFINPTAPNPWEQEYEIQRQQYANKMQAAQSQQAAARQQAMKQVYKSSILEEIQKNVMQSLPPITGRAKVKDYDIGARPEDPKERKKWIERIKALFGK